MINDLVYLKIYYMNVLKNIKIGVKTQFSTVFIIIILVLFSISTFSISSILVSVQNNTLKINNLVADTQNFSMDIKSFLDKDLSFDEMQLSYNSFKDHIIVRDDFDSELLWRDINAIQELFKANQLLEDQVFEKTSATIELSNGYIETQIGRTVDPVEKKMLPTWN